MQYQVIIQKKWVFQLVFEIIDGIGRYSVLNNEETRKAGKYLSMINGEAKFFRIIIKKRGN